MTWQASIGARPLQHSGTLSEQDMRSPYPTLLSPIRIGTHRLPNRIIMGSLHTRLENEPNAVARLATFYAARAKGRVSLITTGGVAPNEAGRIEDGAQVLDTAAKLHEHRPIVQAVHAHGTKIIMQVLHTGAYAKHDQIVAPSAIRSPINRRTPREMTTDEIEQTLEDFVRCAELARDAGYDGIELMGSEGYLLNQFVVLRTNQRTDEWGGSFARRIRFPVEIVRRTRQRLGPDFLMFYRLSVLDLVEGGLTGDEIDMLARAIEHAGIDVLTTGVGWHESTVPTIATAVPRAAFAFASQRLKNAVSVPVVASNRINMPETAEAILASGQADLVSLARPFLADPEFVNKVIQSRAADINTCIGCNQACLDRIFSGEVASCLVNPKACHEDEFPDGPATTARRLVVVGAGPAGLACAVAAAERGHQVVLYEAQDAIGGQLNLARRIPGKEQEFAELIRYYGRRLEQAGVDVRLGTAATADALGEQDFDHIVIATGTRPRGLELPGVEHAKVTHYADLILGHATAGQRVAIIGAGGVGHDVAELLTAPDTRAQTVPEFLQYWGVDTDLRGPGGLTLPKPERSPRQVTLFQRGTGKAGASLGKSTGWIHRVRLGRRGVGHIGGCVYHGIDDHGLHYSIDGKRQLARVDTIVLCAGQEPVRELARSLRVSRASVHVIGGARLATGLDAMRAIDEGTRLAYAI